MCRQIFCRSLVSGRTRYVSPVDFSHDWQADLYNGQMALQYDRRVEGAPFIPTSPTSARRSRAITILELVIGIGGVGVLLVWLLSTLSSHIFAGNSDGATVALEGQSINAGHLLLQGWALSRDSFWSIDAMLYAVVVHFIGVKQALLHVVPAIIAALIVLLGTWFVRDEHRGPRSWIAPFAVLAVIGLPSPVLSYFLLQGPWHVGTALWCLVAFAGLANDRWHWGFGIALLALAAGLLGDLETLPFGVIPAVLAGVCEMGRRRSWRHGLPSVAAGLGASLFAYIVRLILDHSGAFTVSQGITNALSNRYGTNIGHAFTWMSGLFGVTNLKIGPASSVSKDALTNGPLLGHIVRLPLLALVVFAVLMVLTTLVGALIFGARAAGPGNRSQRLDELLLFGTAGSIASFIVLCPNNNADYARYLTAAVICSTVLGGRLLTRMLVAYRSRTVFASTAAALLIICGAIGLTTAHDLNQSPAKQPATELAAFLEQHHLTVGVGDYWSSSIVTLASDGHVVIRPVITNPKKAIVRYERQSTAGWYGSVPFQFLVYNVKRPWRGINAVTAITTFGRPKIGYDVGNYRVIVWRHPLSISTVGYTRG